MIVSTTITDSNGDIIRDALESLVYWVDKCIVIDTGITDNTLEIAHEVAGSKLVVHRFPWVNDFAAARNFALQAAQGEGADWAWTLDSDERMLFRSEWSNHELETNGDLWVLFTYQMDQSYIKERIIRLGKGVRWQGLTHECAQTIPDENRALTLNLSFTELQKTPHQMYQKNVRDLELLTQQVASQPEEPRWWRYLGSTYLNMRRYEEALPPLLKCVSLAGAEGEGGNAVCRALQCYGHLRRWQEAIDLCDRALDSNPEDEKLREFLEVARGKLLKEIVVVPS